VQSFRLSTSHGLPFVCVFVCVCVCVCVRCVCVFSCYAGEDVCVCLCLLAKNQQFLINDDEYAQAL